MQENDYAGYVMAHVGGDGWRGNFGVRLVDTERERLRQRRRPDAGDRHPADDHARSAYGRYFVDHVKHNYFDVLPSVNFTFDLQKNLLLRVSAAETMSRPDYSALGGTVSLTDLTLTGNGGNPNLKPIKAAVYDAALEWYYAPTARGGGQPLLRRPVVLRDLRAPTRRPILNQLPARDRHAGRSDTSYVIISSPTNISGQLKGVELQVQQPLPYDFGFQANFTYVDGADAQGNPLVGTSKVTYNLVGYYECNWFSVRLAYTYRSHYFVGLDRSAAENEAGYGELDASVNFNITKNITFTVDALNLTNKLLKYYAANPTQVRAVYENGTQVYAGVHVKF